MLKESALFPYTLYFGTATLSYIYRNQLVKINITSAAEHCLNGVKSSQFSGLTSYQLENLHVHLDTLDGQLPIPGLPESGQPKHSTERGR